MEVFVLHSLKNQKESHMMDEHDHEEDEQDISTVGFWLTESLFLSQCARFKEQTQWSLLSSLIHSSAVHTDSDAFWSNKWSNKFRHITN